MKNIGGSIGKKTVAVSLVLCLACLVSCGGEQDMKQEFTPDAVSKSAIEDKQDFAENEGASAQYKYRNSTNLYMEDEWSLKQRDLNGGLQKTYTLESKGFEYLREVYTDDNWLYYIRGKKESETPTEELWRAPIKKTDDGDEVQIHQEEKLLVEKEGISDAIYISDDFVYYNRENLGTNYGTPCIYNTAKKKWVNWPKGLPREIKNGVVVWRGIYDGVPIIERFHQDRAGSAQGLYALENKKFRKIGKNVSSSFVQNQTTCFWGGKADGLQEVYDTQVMLYQSDMGKSKVVISQEQLLEAMKHTDYAASEVAVRRLYLDGNKLYILAQALVNYEGFGMTLFRCDIENPSALVCETTFCERYREELSNCDAINHIKCIVDGKCVLAVSSENDGYECFDFNTGESKVVTEADAEYWWQYWG